MSHQQINSEVFIFWEELSEIGIEALKVAGVPPADAKIAVDVLLRANLRGIDTHGIQRLLMYIPRIRKGLINPRPAIRIEHWAPATKIVCGDDGLGPVVATRAMKEAIALAKDFGISFVGCRDSNHFGAAAPYVLMACEERLIGITGSNAFPTMAPSGGMKNLIGNNPLAIGVPADGLSPFVLDMAMSVSSRGRIREMAEKGEKIPEGWALDAEGKPTTDPLDGLKGLVLPVGLHKGYALALAIEILSGVMTGAGFSKGVKSLVQQWEEPQHVGHFFIGLDPLRFMTWEDFSKRMSELYKMMRSAPPLDPQRPILIPGEPEANTEENRRKNGIPMAAKDFEILKGLARGNYDYEIPRF